MGETQEMVRRKLPLDLGHDAEWLVRAYIAECHGWSVEVDVEGGPRCVRGEVVIMMPIMVSCGSLM